MAEPITCKLCKGEGVVEAGPIWSDDYMRDVTCPICEGSGWFCSECDLPGEDCDCSDSV